MVQLAFSFNFARFSQVILRVSTSFYGFLRNDFTPSTAFGTFFTAAFAIF